MRPCRTREWLRSTTIVAAGLALALTACKSKDPSATDGGTGGAAPVITTDGASGSGGVMPVNPDTGVTPDLWAGLPDGAWIEPASCGDQRPPAGTEWVRPHNQCRLPNGGEGRGAGAWGCYPAYECGPPACRPEKGKVACRLVFGMGSSGIPWAGSHCVYQTCSAATEMEYCDRGAAPAGTCCKGICAVRDYFTDPQNCGRCGHVCPSGVACVEGTCRRGPGDDTCGPGHVRGSGFYGCVATACAGVTEGTFCRLTDDIKGICCNGACVAEDQDNCGACGARCCAGVGCQVNPVNDGRACAASP